MTRIKTLIASIPWPRPTTDISCFGRPNEGRCPFRFKLFRRRIAANCSGSIVESTGWRDIPFPKHPDLRAALLWPSGNADVPAVLFTRDGAFAAGIPRSRRNSHYRTKASPILTNRPTVRIKVHFRMSTTSSFD